MNASQQLRVLRITFNASAHIAQLSHLFCTTFSTSMSDTPAAGIKAAPACLLLDLPVEIQLAIFKFLAPDYGSYRGRAKDAHAERSVWGSDDGSDDGGSEHSNGSADSECSLATSYMGSTAATTGSGSLDWDDASSDHVPADPPVPSLAALASLNQTCRHLYDLTCPLLWETVTWHDKYDETILSPYIESLIKWVPTGTKAWSEGVLTPSGPSDRVICATRQSREDQGQPHVSTKRARLAAEQVVVLMTGGNNGHEYTFVYYLTPEHPSQPRQWNFTRKIPDYGLVAIHDNADKATLPPWVDLRVETVLESHLEEYQECIALPNLARTTIPMQAVTIRTGESRNLECKWICQDTADMSEIVRRLAAEVCAAGSTRGSGTHALARQMRTFAASIKNIHWPRIELHVTLQHYDTAAAHLFPSLEAARELIDAIYEWVAGRMARRATGVEVILCARDGSVLFSKRIGPLAPVTAMFGLGLIVTTVAV